jgi:DNA-binding MarR family transcriptional regulator
MREKVEVVDTRRIEAGQIVKSIRLIKDVHRRYSGELMKKYRMTGQQAGALSIVAQEPGISLGELGERMYLHISTCSGIVDRLERKGYVTRRRGPEDRRVVRLVITPRGRQLIRRMPVSGFGMLMKEIHSLPARDTHKVCEAMKILMRIMKIEWTEEKEVSHGR